jgi:hypothetical protein
MGRIIYHNRKDYLPVCINIAVNPKPVMPDTDWYEVIAQPTHRIHFNIGLAYEIYCDRGEVVIEHTICGSPKYPYDLLKGGRTYALLNKLHTAEWVE